MIVLRAYLEALFVNKREKQVHGRCERGPLHPPLDPAPAARDHRGPRPDQGLAPAVRSPRASKIPSGVYKLYPKAVLYGDRTLYGKPWSSSLLRSLALVPISGKLANEEVGRKSKRTTAADLQLNWAEEGPDLATHLLLSIVRPRAPKPGEGERTTEQAGCNVTHAWTVLV